jgi:KEOPS complex subunit Cgi121
MISVFGAKHRINNIDSFLQQLEKIAIENKLIIQVFDADVIYGKNHLLSATEHAQRAFKQKTESTNSLAKEILLYAAGERQIQKAIKKMGIKKTTTKMAFVIINESKITTPQMNGHIKNFLKKLEIQKDDKVLEGDRDTLRRFGLTEDEIKTVQPEQYGDLILEKVALVDIIK